MTAFCVSQRKSGGTYLSDGILMPYINGAFSATWDALTVLRYK